LLAAALCLLALPAAAAEFRSAGDNGAVLYDAPSKQATPLFVVTHYYPLEVLVEVEGWAKVRDATGAISWVEKGALSERQMVVVTAASAEARERPDEAAPVAFVAARNVALELLDPAPQAAPDAAHPAWLHVRHADGADGYLRASACWGD
jgi:SH3-like domain-containing protein